MEPRSPALTVGFFTAEIPRKPIIKLRVVLFNHIPWGRLPPAPPGKLLFCLENPMGKGAWQAIVHEVAKSQTQPIDFHPVTH